MQVIPSIIPKNKEQLEDEIELVAGFADFVQIDISDGIFTPFKTWPYNGQDYDFFDELKNEKIGWPKWESVDFEIHLMVKNPESVLNDWIKTGVSSVVAHIEAMAKPSDSSVARSAEGGFRDDFQKIIDICKENQTATWIAIKPSTDISKIAPFVSQVDGVQCMGSDLLGQHGVELEDRAVEQIKKLRELSPDTIIAVDIGVNLETKDELLEAGATKLICGSAILDAENPKEAFEELSE